jgi:hypothetical protein
MDIILMLDFNAIGDGTGLSGKRFHGPGMRKVLADLERELKEGMSEGVPHRKDLRRVDIILEFRLWMIKRRK